MHLTWILSSLIANVKFLRKILAYLNPREFFVFKRVFQPIQLFVRKCCSTTSLSRYVTLKKKIALVSSFVDYMLQIMTSNIASSLLHDSANGITFPMDVNIMANNLTRRTAKSDSVLAIKTLIQTLVRSVIILLTIPSLKWLHKRSYTSVNCGERGHVLQSWSSLNFSLCLRFTSKFS